MRKILIGLLLAALLALAGAAWGGTPKNVYLKDGSIIEAESFWRKGNIVYVLVNRDTLVELSQGEVDLTKTFKATNPVKKKKKTTTAKPSAIKPSAANEATAAPTAVPASGSAPSEGKQAPTAAQQAMPEAPKPPLPAVSPAPAPPKPSPPAATPPFPEPPAPGFGMALAAMGMIPLVVAGLVLLLFIITFWKIFEKAGEAGWKSLIPIYNLFILIKIAGKPWWWFLLFLIPLVNIIFNLLWCLALGQKFGKSQLFGVGLFLLGFIFFPILAFDSSRYEG